MSAAAAPGVHLERFAVGGDAIDANRHVDDKEYLHRREAIAIAHSAVCGWPLEHYVASGTSWYVKLHAVEGDRLFDAPRFASTETPSSRRRHAFLRDADRGPVAFARTPARPRGALR